MNKLIVAVFLVVSLGIGYLYVIQKAPTEQLPDLANQVPNTPPVTTTGTLPTGTFTFSEVAEGEDTNGVTTTVYGHTLTLNPNNTFQYSMDGRMALVRVTGDVVVQNNEIQFIARDNPKEGDQEPFPVYEEGSVLFGGKYIAHNDSLILRWVEAKPGLETTTRIVPFINSKSEQ